MSKGRRLQLKGVAAMASLIVLRACGQASHAVMVTMASELLTGISPPAPTIKSTALPASRSTPEAAHIPGEQVYPVSSFGPGIPRLPLDEGEWP